MLQAATLNGIELNMRDQARIGNFTLLVLGAASAVAADMPVG